MPAQVVCPDPVPVALLLPWHQEHGPDALPYRIQVRRGGHVRCDQVPAGNLCVLRRQEVVRPVPQGPLLRHSDVVCAVLGCRLRPRRARWASSARLDRTRRASARRRGRSCGTTLDYGGYSRAVLGGVVQRGFFI